MTTTAKRALNAVIGFYRSYGLGVVVTSTDRTIEQQDALYRAGKTKLPGGYSLHNYGRAADLVPGSPWPAVGQAESFQHIAAVGRYFGWESLVESDHVHLEM